jgi:hypothetical protein
MWEVWSILRYKANSLPCPSLRHLSGAAHASREALTGSWSTPSIVELHNALEGLCSRAWAGGLQEIQREAHSVTRAEVFGVWSRFTWSRYSRMALAFTPIRAILPLPFGGMDLGHGTRGASNWTPRHERALDPRGVGLGRGYSLYFKIFFLRGRF